jgi:hypothetical protein
MKGLLKYALFVDNALKRFPFAQIFQHFAERFLQTRLPMDGSALEGPGLRHRAQSW